MNRGEAKKFQLRGGVLVLILSVLVILSADAFSGPVVKRTTSQQWSFPDGNFGPVLPDAGWDNDFGDPTLWVGDRAVFGNGAWAIKRDEIDIFIPNYTDTSPDSMKEMTVELTWQGANLVTIPNYPEKPGVVVVPDGQYDLITIEPGEDVQLGGGWKKTVFTIDIWPNPSSEWVMIKGDIYLDQVVIKTECIPEPATLALITGGAFLAVRRKRQRVR